MRVATFWLVQLDFCSGPEIPEFEVAHLSGTNARGFPDMTVESDQGRIWHHFQNEAADSFLGAAPRLDTLAKTIAKLSRKAGWSCPSVLNIGIGNGYFEGAMQRQGGDVYSLDPDAEAVERLRKKNVHAQTGRIDAIPYPDGKFHAVVVSEVLEHLSDSDRDRGLDEIRRVLKPLGYVVGTVPYDEDLSANECVCPSCSHVFHRWGHTTSFRQQEIRDLLHDRFDIVFVRRTAFVPFRGRTLIGKLRGVIRLLVAKAGHHVAQPSLFFVAQRRD